VVRDDCRTWTAEVQAAQPTVVFSVRTRSGADLADARVSVDGVPFVDRIDGLARPLDPGPHDIEVQAGSEPPVRVRIVVHEGEKQRVVPVVFRGAEAQSTNARGGGTGTATAAPGTPAASSSITPWIYVTGSAAVVGLAGFAFFGLTAMADHGAMRDGCATTGSCTDAQIDANRTRFWVADASLVVGLVGAGLTGWLLYDHSKSSSSAASGAATTSRAPTTHAGDVQVSARFRDGPFLQLDALF
jgi:hypothetical protein